MTIKFIKLEKAEHPYKWEAVLMEDDTERRIKFGRQPYEDYTIHKNNLRKESYLKRHQKNENWGKSGILTRGFWSRWILWNKPTIEGSLRDLRKRFAI